MKKIHYCRECKVYTMKSECPKCSKKVELCQPPKFSIQDKYARHRRMTKYESEEE